jgi:short-subunit dehydrogenase
VDLTNAICLVTGASAGIGRETAIALAETGAILAVCARRKDKLDETLAACRRHSPTSVAVQCDVSDSSQVQQMVDEVTRQLGDIDVLVANAGWGRYAAFDEETIETIDSQVKTNILGQMYCTHAVLPEMKRRQRGHLVFLSSTNGRIPPPMQSVYNATKFAALGFGETLSYEVKPFGIGVTIVYPGPIETEFFEAEEFQRMRKPKLVPARKMADAIVKGIERNRMDVTLPWALKIPAKMRALFPNLIRRGVGNYAKRSIPRPE